MSLFGWLTKGQMEVSFLDTITMFIELVVVFIGGLSVVRLIESFQRRRRRRSRNAK